MHVCVCKSEHWVFQAACRSSHGLHIFLVIPSASAYPQPLIWLNLVWLHKNLLSVQYSSNWLSLRHPGPVESEHLLLLLWNAQIRFLSHWLWDAPTGFFRSCNLSCSIPTAAIWGRGSVPTTAFLLISSAFAGPSAFSFLSLQTTLCSTLLRFSLSHRPLVHSQKPPFGFQGGLYLTNH